MFVPLHVSPIISKYMGKSGKKVGQGGIESGYICPCVCLLVGQAHQKMAQETEVVSYIGSAPVVNLNLSDGSQFNGFSGYECY